MNVETTKAFPEGTNKKNPMNLSFCSICYQIFESGVDSRTVFCGVRLEQLDGETVSNKLYVHFYSDDSVMGSGFLLSFAGKEGIYKSKLFQAGEPTS